MILITSNTFYVEKTRLSNKSTFGVLLICGIIAFAISLIATNLIKRIAGWIFMAFLHCVV